MGHPEIHDAACLAKHESRTCFFSEIRTLGHFYCFTGGLSAGKVALSADAALPRREKGEHRC
jgi:hypothetical protein